jgi:hypothetical protein
MEKVTLSYGSEWRQRANKLESNAVEVSDFVSGGEIVNDISKIPDGLARRDVSFSPTVKSQFQAQGICVHLMGNSPGDRL